MFTRLGIGHSNGDWARHWTGLGIEHSNVHQARHGIFEC